MAGPLARLYATLGLDAREFDSGLGKAQKSISGFGKGADLAMGLAAGAVTAGLLGTIGAAREWETAFTGVQKTMDTTGMSAEQQAAAFAMVEEDLRELAKTIPMTTTELAGLAEAGGAMGIAAKDLGEFARVTALIGTTTNVVAQDAATSLGKIGNVIGLTADEYDNFGATLVDLGNKGASFESEILEVANNIVGTSKSIGLSAQEMLGWASAISDVGIAPEAARGSFQKFGKTVQEAALLGGKNLDTLAGIVGMTGEEFQRAFGEDVSGTLEAVIEGLSDMDAATRITTMGLLGFTDIRVKDFFDKLSGSVDNLTDSLDTSGTAWEANEALMTEAERRFDTIDSGMIKFWNRVNDVAITLGRTFVPILRGSVEHLGNLVDIVGDAAKAFPQVTNVVTPLVTALSGLMALKFGARFLGAMIPGGGMFAEALTSSIGGPVSGVASKLGLTFGRTFGLAAAAAAIMVFAPEMMAVWDKIRGQIEGIGKQAEAIKIGTFSKAEMEAQLAVVEKGIADIRRKTGIAAAKEGEGIVLFPELTGLTQLEKTRDELRAQLALIGSDLRSAAADPTARKAWDDILNGPRELMATGMAEQIKTFLGGATSAVADWAKRIGGVAPEVAGSFKDITTSIRQGFGNVKAALKSGDQQMIDPATRMSNMRNRLAQVAQKLNQAISVGDPWAISYWTDAYAKQQSLLTGLEGAVGQTKGQVTASLRSMGINVDRIWGKVKRDTKQKSGNAADSAISAARRTARLVARAFQGLAPKAGAWGADVTRAFAAGLARKNALAAIEAGATNVMASVQDFMRTGSPTKKGPGSKDGGPEGWGEKWGRLFGEGLAKGKPGDSLGQAMRPRALAAVNVPVGGGGRDGNVTNVYIQGHYFATDANYRKLSGRIDRAERQTRRERRHNRLAEG